MIRHDNETPSRNHDRREEAVNRLNEIINSCSVPPSYRSLDYLTGDQASQAYAEIVVAHELLRSLERHLAKLRLTRAQQDSYGAKIRKAG